MRTNLEAFSVSRSRPLLLKAGEVFLMKEMRNPVQGVRGHRLRSTCPAWGVSSLVTGRTAGDLLRGSLANPTTANSSTMKGPRGLAGESCGRRCRTAKDLGRWVRGCFYVRSLRNRSRVANRDLRSETMPVLANWTYGQIVPPGNTG